MHVPSCFRDIPRSLSSVSVVFYWFQGRPEDLVPLQGISKVFLGISEALQCFQEYPRQFQEYSKEFQVRFMQCPGHFRGVPENLRRYMVVLVASCEFQELSSGFQEV